MSKDADRGLTTRLTSDLSGPPEESPVDTTAIGKAVTRVTEVKQSLLVQSDLADNVLAAAGQYDGKRRESIALSTHILNTTLTGLTAYIYETIVEHGVDLDEQRLRVLTAALVLHDVNKYVNEAYGWDADANTRAVFDRYLEDDPFGVREFLGDDELIEDVWYLVQRTEVTEDARDTRDVDLTTEVRGFDRYCRIGDTGTSRILNNGIRDGASWLTDQFRAAESNPVQLLTFHQITQPLLNRELIGLVKEFLRGGDAAGRPQGVVLGSTPEAVLYLGNPVELSVLKEWCAERLPESVNDHYEFDCKTYWQSFEPDVLEEIDIPYEEKRRIIASGFADVIRGGQGVSDFDGFESVPEDLEAYLPDLVRELYDVGQMGADGEFEEPELNALRDQVIEDYGSQKRKIGFLFEIVEAWPEHKDALEALHERVAPELKADLTPEGSPLRTAVERFFSLQDDPSMLTSGETCFLCGRPAERKYKKGHETFYSTNAFSRRVGPEQVYKRICPVCNLEYELLAYECAVHDQPIRRSSEMNIVYLYFDEFVADLQLFGDLADDPLLRGAIDISEPQPRIDLFAMQYHLLPFNQQHSQQANENYRLMLLRQVFQTLAATGMQATIGKPFTPFTPSRPVFRDTEATRTERGLGIAELDRYDDLRRALALFDILAWVGGIDEKTNQYLALRRDDFHEIADLVVTSADQPVTEQVTTYFETYHSEAFMDMQTVAREGLDLYGMQFGSKHKKTKIFRTAIDALLSGLGQSMSGDQLHQHVAGQVYAAAERDQYAGHVTTDEAAAFTDAVLEYLESQDLLSMQKLADWQNTLTNSYLYAYETVRDEAREEESESGSSSTPDASN